MAKPNIPELPVALAIAGAVLLVLLPYGIPDHWPLEDGPGNQGEKKPAANILNVTDIFALPMEAAGKEVTVEGWTIYETDFDYTVSPHLNLTISGPFSGQIRDRFSSVRFQGEVDSWQWDHGCTKYRLTGIVRFNESDLICTCRIRSLRTPSEYVDFHYSPISACTNETESPTWRSCLPNTTRAQPFLELTGSPGEPACPEGFDPQAPSKGPDAWWRKPIMQAESAG